jgi:putative transposase
VRKNYQRKERKSNHKFEVVRGQELMVQVPLPIAEVWAELQAQVEELTGQAGLQILRAILENEVTHRVGSPHRPNPSAGCVRWGKQPGYVVFGGQKIPLERPRVRTPNRIPLAALLRRLADALVLGCQYFIAE